MKFITFIAAGLALAGCSKSPTMTPIQAAGCAVETAIEGGAATALATALSCGNQAAIQASIATALGNANLCKTPIPPAPVSAMSKAAVGPVWQTIGDVPGSALQSHAVKADAVKAMGVVGNIACPIAINTIVGFLSNSVPSSWSCSAGATASSVEATLVSVCETIVPI